jgi:AGZA family xanthine/uracil permease-like MFS transporter
VPALAYLAVLALKQLSPELKPFEAMQPGTQHWIQTVTCLAGGGGFIVTSLLWSTALAHVIDGRVRAVIGTLLLASAFSWFGVIHSPLPSSPILPPAEVVRELEAQGRARASAQQTPYHWSAAYALMALAVLALSRLGTLPPTRQPDPDHSN